jgi:SAM-dependent methyltransferase
MVASSRWLKAQKCEAAFYEGSKRWETGSEPPWIFPGVVLEIGGREYAESSDMRLKVVLDPIPWGSTNFVKGVGEIIPLKSHSVSQCYMMNTIDHCANPQKVLSEIGRVLEPHGQLEISCNVFSPWLSPLFPLLNRIDGPHPWHFSKGSFYWLVCGSGFIIEHSYSWIPRANEERRFLSRLKVSLAKMFGLTHIVLRCHCDKNATVS